MPERAPLAAVSGFAGTAAPLPAGRGPAGVTVAERLGLGLATVTLRRDAAGGRFAAVLSEAFGIAAPAPGPRVSSSGDTAFVGTGPRSFLAVKAGGGWRFAEELRTRLAGVAAVADQSSGYAVLRLAGPRVREVLAKGVPVDLHPAAFGPGDAAVTLASHVGIVLWQVDAAPTYDIAVFRSQAASFGDWLAAGAAEFGLVVSAPIG